MEDQVITTAQSTEPIVVESANTSAENTAGLSQVIDQATPMDSNTTYDSLAKEEYQPNMSVTQNLINKAVHKEQTVNQDTNAGKAMNNFFTNKYDYDKAEAGSYWVAGAINDNNTQMSFLETLINEEMYDEMDLQKYYYDTNLATARAYAAQKNKEVAYGFYRAAQEKALAEADLTGWYMPAEGQYLLAQYTVAQTTLENPNATPEELSKANRVSKAAESWFKANQITTQGIKCLSMMNYEESVRHNTIMGKLNEQANQIAASAAAASAAGSALAKLKFKFDVEEEEMDKGYNFSKKLGMDNDDHIGHREGEWGDRKYLKGYANAKELLKNDTEHFAEVKMAASTDYIKGILGEDYYDANLRFENDQSLSGHKADISTNNQITSESPGFNSTGKKTDGGQEVKYTVVGNKVVVGYFDDGVWVPITDEKAVFSDNKKIKDFIEKQFGKDSMSTTGINSVTIDGETYTFGRSNTQNAKNSYTNLVEAGYSKNIINNEGGAYNEKGVKQINELIIASQSEEGITTKDGKKVRNLKYKGGYVDKKNTNEFVILEGEDGEYYAPEQKFSGEWQLKKLEKHNLVETKKVSETYEVGDTWDDAGGMFGDSDKALIAKSSWYMGTDTENNIHYMYVPHGNDYEIVGVQYTNKLSASAQKTYGKNFSAGTSWYKVVSINPSEDTLSKAGIQLPKDTTSKTAETSYNNTPTQNNETNIDSGGSVTVPSGGSNTFKENNYSADQITAVYRKHNVSYEDAPKIPDSINNISELEEWLKNIPKVIGDQGGDQNGK